MYHRKKYLTHRGLVVLNLIRYFGNHEGCLVANDYLSNAGVN